MPALFIALMSIPVAFVIAFWVLANHDGLRNPETRRQTVLFLFLITGVEAGVWVWWAIFAD